MRNSFKIATIGGIEISINWSWLLAFAFITWSLGDYYDHTFLDWGAGTSYIVGAISALLLFVTVLLHELAHSFTARAQGLPVRTIVLFIFGGVSNLTQEPRTPRIELLVTIAGPLTSLVLAGLFFLLHALLAGAPSEVTAVLFYLASVNLLLALFNLIPGFPLDGGRVLRALIWLATGSMRRATRAASNVGQVIGYLFILAGLVFAFVLGQVTQGIWLAFIGWFLHNSASSSYQQAVMDQVLRGVEVQDVMDQAPAAAAPTVSVELLVYQHMLTDNQRAVPIQGPDGTLLGLVTLGDVRHLSRDDWHATPISQIMTPTSKLCTVAPAEDLRNALQTMAENDYHQLPVVQNGRLVGMLDRSHVLQYIHVRQQIGRPRPGSGVLPGGSPPTDQSAPPRRHVG